MSYLHLYIQLEMAYNGKAMKGYDTHMAESDDSIEQKGTSKPSPAIQYANELKDDLNLTLSNLREKSLTTSSMKAKWVGYMAKEKDALQKLVAIRNEYQKSLVGKGGSQNAFDRLKTANQEDETLKKIDQTRKNIELSLEVIAQAITALSEFGYNIKNVIEVTKLNNY